MKRLTIPCDFGGKKIPFHIYVGDASSDRHPLHFQSHWLSTERGGSIPHEVMESFEKLRDIALENGKNFEDIVMYAMEQAKEPGKEKDSERSE
jgi:hypothetical protein